MSQSPDSAKSERILGSFASLLSSALTIDGDSGVEPLKESSGTLPKLISSSVLSDHVCCMIPTFLLKHSDHNNGSSPGASSLEDAAALNLARPLALTRVELEAAPIALLGNLSEAFSILVDSRLRSCLSALMRNAAQRQQDLAFTHMLVRLLSASNNPITPTTVVTSFRCIPKSTDYCSSTGDLIMPLVMELVFDLQILGELFNVNMIVPGTIQAAFDSGDLGITKAEIVLDTVSLLHAMMKQARFAVRQAITLASSATAKLLLPTAQQGSLTSSLSSLGSLTDLSRRQMIPTPVASASSFSMPPPPRRPSMLSVTELETGGIKAIRREPTTQNATWDKSSTTGDAPESGGLALLTQAMGLEKTNGRNDHEQAEGRPNKKVRRSTSPTTVEAVPPVSSCPHLDTIIAALNSER